MDVYDSVRSSTLMIPKGSKLIGQYNADIRIGQERMMAAFSRIIRPDGSSINLAGMPGADQIGQAGLHGDVNNHFWKMFSSSFLIAGVSWLFDKNSDNRVIVNNSTTQTPMEMTGEILKDISKTILDRNTSIPPTITVEKGQKLNIIVNKDISIPAYSPR
ncbi:type IV secretion system protein VirB10 [Thauera mechernichensis]